MGVDINTCEICDENLHSDYGFDCGDCGGWICKWCYELPDEIYDDENFEGECYAEKHKKFGYKCPNCVTIKNRAEIKKKRIKSDHETIRKLIAEIVLLTLNGDYEAIKKNEQIIIDLIR